MALDINFSFLSTVKTHTSDIVSFNSVAEVLLPEPEVAHEPVFVARGRFSEYKRMWPVKACHLSFFFQN